MSEQPLIPQDQEKSTIQKELTHINILLKKNFLNLLSSKKQLIIQLMSPLIISKNKISHETLEWPIIPVNESFVNPQKKYQLVHAQIGQNAEWTDYSLKYIEQNTGFNNDQMISIYHNDTNVTTALTDINDYFKDHQDEVQIGVIFCTSNKPIIEKFPINCNENPIDFQNQELRTYLILLNFTDTQTAFISDAQTPLSKAQNALSLKLLIDNSVISFSKWKKQNPDKKFDPKNDDVLTEQSLKIQQQDYPTVPFRIFDGQDVVAQTGCKFYINQYLIIAFYFLVPIMFTFLQINQDLVKEKEYQIRQYLHTIGVSWLSYWISWTITCFFNNLLVSISICIFGYIFQFQYFLDTPFIILFFLFFSLAFSFNSISFFLVTISPNLKVSNSTSYGFMLVSFVLQLLLSNIILVYNLYGDEVPWWVTMIRYLLTLYPPFNFAKAFGDISQYSGNHYDSLQNKWITGTGYTYSQFTKEINLKMQGVHVNAPSTYDSISFMYLDTLFFLIMAWYLDSVIFRELPPNFLFTKKYWSPPQVQVSQQNYQTNNSNVIVEDIQKTYRKNIWNKNGFQALKGVSFQVEKGELLSILGHNGAGKSTLISIMTGNLQPTNGNIKIDNMEISQNKEQIRKLIGICPQFDIQWPELTARQHIEIFSAIKFVDNEYMDRLDKVGLQHVAEARVRTFSGGMKRRLSIAVSGIGNPKILFLDEPTTGMDPKSRRQVWNLIQNLKKDKSIILTTHAMEEADVLSDRIMVVNRGLKKCIGTSLNLKNTYGEGYKLSLIVDNKYSEKIQQYICSLIPSAKLLDSSGGSLLFTIPLKSISQLQAFFQLIEINQDEKSLEIKSMIQDWNLSNTTLEEVFMKMTGDDVD